MREQPSSEVRDISGSGWFDTYIKYILKIILKYLYWNYSVGRLVERHVITCMQEGKNSNSIVIFCVMKYITYFLNIEFKTVFIKKKR